MRFQRRQFLQILSHTLGSSFIFPQDELAKVVQNTAQPASPAALGNVSANHERGETEMEKVAESEGCSSELMIQKRWKTGTCNTWELRSHQRARAKPFGNKKPDQPPSVRFPRPLNISEIRTRPGW